MTVATVFHYFRVILGPETNIYVLALIYGVGISLLSVATPVSVQMLINSVAASGLATPLVVLSLSLLLLLLMSALMSAMRIYLVDIFGRKFYSRMVAEISLRALYARNPFFEDHRKGTLFNRYFDIIVVMSRIPDILVGGFTILLQAAAGFLLVSFYHPFLLMFSLAVIALIWVVWLIWGRAGVVSAVHVSHAKHKTAGWLEGLGRANGFYKSDGHIAEALSVTDQVTGEYIDAHRRHFRHHYSQTISFLVIYAVASAALLGLGGWLVIVGQLSLGQLVAAELVLSTVLYGISQLGIYMSYFYDVCGAIDEISLFFQEAQHTPKGLPTRIEGDSALELLEIHSRDGSLDLSLNFQLSAGTRLGVYANSYAAQSRFTELLKGQITPDSGYIAIGGTDLRTLEPMALRQDILVVDRANVLEATIRDYLRLSAGHDQHEALMAAIRTVGLEDIVLELPEGLDTHMVATGWPLSVTATMQVKLAAALLAKPKILILTQLIDALPERDIAATLAALSEQGATVIYFTNKHTNFGFHRYLFLDRTKQSLFADYSSLCDELGFAFLPLRPPVEGHGVEPKPAGV